MRKAAKMRASEVQRLIDCPGSRAACEGLPDKPGDDAERGVRIHDMLPDMPAEKLSALGRAVKLVSSKADMILDEIRRRVEADPDSVPGWSLKEGKKRRTITEPARVIKAVAERTGASVGSVINSLAKVSVTAIGDVLKDEGLTKDEVSVFWQDELAVWIEETRDRETLVYK
jgi:hypothetical protein